MVYKERSTGHLWEDEYLYATGRQANLPSYPENERVTPYSIKLGELFVNKKRHAWNQYNLALEMNSRLHDEYSCCSCVGCCEKAAIEVIGSKELLEEMFVKGREAVERICGKKIF